MRDRGKRIGVRVQRRVRMGKKDEVGSPYILSPFLDHMTVYLCLFGYLNILISPSRDPLALEEHSRRF